MGDSEDSEATSEGDSGLKEALPGGRGVIPRSFNAGWLDGAVHCVHNFRNFWCFSVVVVWSSLWQWAGRRFGAFLWWVGWVRVFLCFARLGRSSLARYWEAEIFLQAC